MASVRLDNVEKIYDGNVVAVRDCNIEIKDKEFVVLVGPSGCGKSTTLRMIAGLEEITAGQILIDDVVVNDLPPKDRDIAMVFQNYALYPHMSVYENMAFGLKLRKFSKSEIDSRVRDAAKILGIEEYLDRKPKALSGGQRQRVAVGRAIVRKPKVFLFDEPLSNLDAKLRVQMRTEISKLHRRLEATMVYVTHDQMEAMTMGDKIVVMKDGIIHQIDTPLDIYNSPNNIFVAGFIGSPSMNFIEGMITDDSGIGFKQDDGPVQFKLSDKHTSLLKSYSGKSIVMGIRPEHIHDKHAQHEGYNVTPVTVNVEVVEPMGNEIFVYFTVGSSSQLVARIPTALERKSEMPEPGRTYDIYFDIDKVQYFDKETTHSIIKHVDTSNEQRTTTVSA
jgi:multiple sugar transport system ATP-binding protein